MGICIFRNSCLWVAFSCSLCFVFFKQQCVCEIFFYDLCEVFSYDLFFLVMRFPTQSCVFYKVLQHIMERSTCFTLWFGGKLFKRIYI